MRTSRVSMSRPIARAARTATSRPFRQPRATKGADTTQTHPLPAWFHEPGPRRVPRPENTLNPPAFLLYSLDLDPPGGSRMEPAVETKPKGTSKGRKGSLENPEVYENVPGHVIPILEREFDDFDTEATKFLAGDIPEDKFIGFRLKQGVYGQRQADAQMMRIKLPFGGVTPEQMEAFAEVAETYAPLGKGHITTRQNFQFHHIPLPDAQKVLRLVAEAG